MDILINVVLIQSIIQQWSLYVIYFELQFEMKKRWKTLDVANLWTTAEG